MSDEEELEDHTGCMYIIGKSSERISSLCLPPAKSTFLELYETIDLNLLLLKWTQICISSRYFILGE